MASSSEIREEAEAGGVCGAGAALCCATANGADRSNTKIKSFTCFKVKTPRASLWKQRTTWVIEGLGPYEDC